MNGEPAFGRGTGFPIRCPIEIGTVNLNFDLITDLASHWEDRRHPCGRQFAKRLDNNRA